MNLDFELREMPEKLVHDLWIEMNARPASQECGCLVQSHSTPEGSIFTNRIEAIHNSQNPRRQRNLFTSNGRDNRDRPIAHGGA